MYIFTLCICNYVCTLCIGVHVQEGMPIPHTVESLST